jgi:hypothetical protein
VKPKNAKTSHTSDKARQTPQMRKRMRSQRLFVGLLLITFLCIAWKVDSRIGSPVLTITGFIMIAMYTIYWFLRA